MSEHIRYFKLILPFQTLREAERAVNYYFTEYIDFFEKIARNDTVGSPIKIWSYVKRRSTAGDSWVLAGSAQEDHQGEDLADEAYILQLIFKVEPGPSLQDQAAFSARSTLWLTYAPHCFTFLFNPDWEQPYGRAPALALFVPHDEDPYFLNHHIQTLLEQFNSPFQALDDDQTDDDEEHQLITSDTIIALVDLMVLSFRRSMMAQPEIMFRILFAIVNRYVDLPEENSIEFEEAIEDLSTADEDDFAYKSVHHIDSQTEFDRLILDNDDQ